MTRENLILDPTSNWKPTYLGYIGSHSVGRLKENTIGKKECLVYVGEATLITNPVKQADHLVCTLNTIKPHDYLRSVTVCYSCYVCAGRADVKSADKCFQKSFHSFPIGATNRSR